MILGKNVGKHMRTAILDLCKVGKLLYWIDVHGEFEEIQGLYNNIQLEYCTRIHCIRI